MTAIPKGWTDTISLTWPRSSPGIGGMEPEELQDFCSLVSFTKSLWNSNQGWQSSKDRLSFLFPCPKNDPQAVWSLARYLPSLALGGKWGACFRLMLRSSSVLKILSSFWRNWILLHLVTPRGSQKLDRSKASAHSALTFQKLLRLDNEITEHSGSSK